MSTSLDVISSLSEAYLDALIIGDRQASRERIQDALSKGASPADLLHQLVWPTMELVQQLFREDRVTLTSLNLATRLNRSIADQLSERLTRKEPNGKAALVLCGDDEPEELGGQLCADLFEAEGYKVRFAGGGVPNDEVLKLVGQLRPNLLILFGTLPSAMPAVRRLIDTLREINACPDMQVMCCGGIYKRAEGLAEEVGADLSAPDCASAIQVALANPTKRATPEQRTVGGGRRGKRAPRRIAPTNVETRAA